MGTQVVKHTSRGVNFTLNFASTENNLSWSFIPEGDGEIYDVESNNVASYTIAGSHITLPYSVTNGSSYAVTLVKTTTGQTASITFKTRRATNKTVSLNVPDFGSYNGRYLFVLSNAQLRKLDTELLKATNYTGNGVWTVAPQIATKTLPVLTGGTGSYYNSMCFVKHTGALGKILIIGRNVVPYPAYNTGNYYYGFVDVADMSLTDLDGNADALTLANSGQNIPIWGILYDYINEFCYVNGNISGHYQFIDLMSPVSRGAIINQYKRNTLVQNFGSNIRNMFNPNQQSFGRAAYVALKKPTEAPVLFSVINALGSKGGLYASDLGKFIVHIDSANNYFSTIDPATGTASASYRLNPDVPLGTIMSSVYDSNLKILIAAGSSNRIAFYNFNTNTSYNYIVTDGIAAGQTGFTDLMPSKHAGLFFARGIGGDGVKRLYVFDITGNSMIVRYLDFDEEITHLYTNQLLS